MLIHSVDMSTCRLRQINNLNIYKQDFGKAKKYYDQAITLDPQQYNALWGLGNIHYKTEKYDDAIKYFKRAEQINPRNSVIQCFLGMAFVNYI